MLLLLKGVLETAKEQILECHPEYLEESTTGNDLILAIEHTIADINDKKILYKEESLEI